MKYLPNQMQFMFPDHYSHREVPKMKTYEVAVPITGWNYYLVKANTSDEAKLLVMAGDIDSKEYKNDLNFNNYEEDLDRNNWEVKELNKNE